jgi:two-component system OmpR family response regulator
MPGDKAKAIPLLDVLRIAGPISSSAMLRIALDVLEPIAASTVVAPVGVRREGSRHEIANVVVGIRGKAKLVGRGNRSGVQVLLWEILATRGAPNALPPPLSAVVDDVESDVAEVIDAAIAGREDLTDARALLKALVIASAGLVGTHRDVAKAVAVAAASPVSAPPPSPPSLAKSTILPPPTSNSAVPQPLRLSASPEADDPMAAELDSVLSIELDRLAPHGWDDWQIAEAKPNVPAIADEETMDGDALIQEIDVASRPPLVRVAPPLPNAVPLGANGAARSDVLMIEPDAFTSAHLAGVLRRAGYSVEVCADPEQAVARACLLQPRIVLCDNEGVGGRATAIALAARTNSPRACLAPFVFIAAHAHASEGEAAKMRGGARDVWLSKPFSTDALLEHVGRFVGPRAAKADSSMLPPLGETAMDGSLSLISLRTLVSMLELERRSGVLKITSRGREAAITLRDGRATRARVQGRKVGAAMALETLLSWDDGRFTFQHALAGAEQPVMADGARSH